MHLPKARSRIDNIVGARRFSHADGSFHELPMEATMKRSLIGALLIACALALSPQAFAVGTAEPEADETRLIDFSYATPEWLVGHNLQGVVERKIEDGYASVKAMAAEMFRESPDALILPFDLSFRLERVVVGEYETIVLYEYSFTGGAHGNYSVWTETLRGGVAVSIRDYLSERGSSPDRFLTILNAALERDGYFTIASIDELNGFWTSWQVHEPNDATPIGIRLVFLPYAVASFSEGTITYEF